MRARATAWVVAAATAGCLGAAAAQETQPPLPPPAALTLRESVAAALRDNPRLEAARAARDLALADAERNRPALRPDVRATASQFVRGPVLKFPKRNKQVTVLPRARSILEINAETPLYQFGIGRAPQDRVEAEEAAAEADYAQAELDLAIDVEEAYLSAQLAQAMEGVAEQALDLAKRQLRVTTALVEQGLLAPVEIRRADAGVAQAEEALERARSGTALANANLNRLLGRPIDAPVAVEPLAGLPPEPGDLASLTAEAVENRPEVRATQAKIAQGEAGEQLARAAGKPRINGDAAYALQNPSAFVPTSSWLVGLSATVPLFDSANTRADVRQAQEGVAQARAGLRALEQGIALEVQRQRLAYSGARERLRVADRELEASQEALRIRMVAFEADEAIPLEVEADRLSVTQAEGRRVQAIHDLWLAHARLRRALGRRPE